METFLETRPRRVTDWLEKNYTNEGTRQSFYLSLKNWIKCFYGKDSVTNYGGHKYGQSRETMKRNIEERINEIEEGIERYFSELDERDYTDDFKKFINWARNDGYANNYVHMMSGKVKTFFARQETRCKISDEDWADIKRTLLPKSTRAATQDDILTKEQLKTILQHLSIHVKALVLFLLSTGARIGAAIQLKMGDINLDSDPPEVNIREEYTKGEVGGRVMWFSYEARDAIIEWHKARLFKQKPSYYGSYDLNLVFNFTYEGVFRKTWNTALRRADGGRVPAVLAKRDPSTKRRIHVYHCHTLRKFFSTNMNLAGVPDMIVHAWMGHKAYLEKAYGKYPKVKLADLYKEHMDVVTVHEVGTDEKARARYKEIEERADKLADQTKYDKAFVDIIGGQLDIPEGLSLDEKKTMIIQNISQIKVDLSRAREQSVEELEKSLKYIPTTK